MILLPSFKEANADKSWTELEPNHVFNRSTPAHGDLPPPCHIWPKWVQKTKKKSKAIPVADRGGL
jgi:hypothetical protein